MHWCLYLRLRYGSSHMYLLAVGPALICVDRVNQPYVSVLSSLLQGCQ